MDQATQVNFATKNQQQKRIRRHNTMADLTHNSWIINRRPISLNITNEMLRIRERTPPPLNNNFKHLNKVKKKNYIPLLILKYNT